MVSSSDLKYKLMRHVTFNPLLFWIASGLIHVFLYEIKKNSVWYNFYQGTSVSITFYIFEHYQLWMMDSKGQRVFFPKTPKLCVWQVRSCYHFKLVSHFQLWFPIWGVLVNRLNSIKIYILNNNELKIKKGYLNIKVRLTWLDNYYCRVQCSSQSNNNNNKTAF